MNLEDIRFLPLARSDYKDGVIIGEPIQNFPEWQVWMQKYWGQGVSREMFDKGCETTTDNRAKFRKHFGKRAFTFRSEFFFDGWRVDLGTTEVLVLTAKGKGTCYEVVTWKDGVVMRTDINRVLEFMDMVAELKG
jgi:hypothetical protein